MSKKALTTAFNSNFKKLAENLHILIPDNEPLETLKNAIHLGSLANPEGYIKHFYQHIVVPYKSQLDSKDDRFFLNLDLTSIQVNLVQDHLDDVTLFKDKWASFTEEQQQLLWQYMTVLQKLAERYATLS